MSPSAKPKPRQGEDPEQPGFDERLARLESLVTELEEGGIDLETALARYEEGVRLLSGCRETLAGYRRRVEELTRGAELALEAFEGDPDASGPG